jgi:hypothetical protein
MERFEYGIVPTKVALSIEGEARWGAMLAIFHENGVILVYKPLDAKLV